MVTASGSHHARGMLALALVVMVLVGCGQSPDPSAHLAAEPTSTTTSEPISPVGATTSSADLLEPTPIPSDPAALGPCDTLPDNVVAATPSRRLPAPPAGWTIRYASTTHDPAPDPSLTLGWSTLVQTDDAGVVTAMVVVTSGPAADIVYDGPHATTLRGVPGTVGPEVTRGGETGAVQALWSEAGLDHQALARGIDGAALGQLVEDLELRSGTVQSPPSGWRSLGAASAKSGGQVTVAGLGPEGDSLLETGYAPVEVAVEEPVDGAAPPGALHVGSGFTLGTGAVRVVTVDGRLALVVDLGDGARLVNTTTAAGAPVQVAGPATTDELIALATTMEAVDLNDARLVGLPMGAEGSSPGAWCR